MKIGNISGDHCHSMGQGGRGDERIAIGTGIGHMQCSTTLRNRGINRKNPSGKGGQYMIIDPRTENRPLHRIATFHEENAEFQFQNRNRGQI